MRYLYMDEEQTPKASTDEIGGKLESENEVNRAIEQQGIDAAAGIPCDTDAAKQEAEKKRITMA